MNNYLRIARIDHWVKNIFAIPGIILAIMLSNSLGDLTLARLLIGLGSLCLLSSANYTINEFLDSEFDKFHPIKRVRPGAKGNLNGQIVFLQYAFLGGFGLLLAYQINNNFLLTGISLLIMGVLYNVEPVRSKDRVYLDVLSESINNPIRLLMGWFIVQNSGLPPSSVLISYWMGGAFLMAAKRYSEYRMIADKAIAGSYRKSFKTYTENSLLLSSFFFAINSAFFLGIFLIKYRVEYLLLFPLLTTLFVWYLHIGFKADSAAQAPEKLYKETGLLLFLLFISCVALILSYIDIPFLRIFQESIY